MSRSSGTLIGAGLLLFAVGCGGGSGPEAAFKDFQAAVKAKDADKAWNLMSKEARGQLDAAANKMKESFKGFDKIPPDKRKAAEATVTQMTGMSLDELKTADGKKLFSLALKNPKLGGGEEGLNEITSATLEKVKVEGDKATGTVKTSKRTDTVHFVKEGGAWKLTPPMGK